MEKELGELKPTEKTMNKSFVRVNGCVNSSLKCKYFLVKITIHYAYVIPFYGQ